MDFIMKLLSNLLFSRQATTSDVHDPARIILKAWSDTSAGYFRLVLPSSNPKEDSCWVSGTSAAYFCQVLASAAYFCRVPPPSTSAGYFCQVLPPSTFTGYFYQVLLPGTSTRYFCWVLLVFVLIAQLAAWKKLTIPTSQLVAEEHGLFGDHQSEVIRSFKLCYSPLSR